MRCGLKIAAAVLYYPTMVTVKDVARLAGVPEKTAARALAGLTMGKRRDARERAERVWEAAAELGYQPSGIAKALRRGRTDTIGLVVGSITNRFYAALAETVMEEAERLGYRMMLEISRWDEARSLDALDHLQQARVDGIFFASGLFPKELPILERLMGMDFPMVMNLPNDQGIASVYADFTVSLPEAVRFLAGRGHREIRFAAWLRRSRLDRMLEELFRDSCRQCGVKPVWELHSSFATMEALAGERPPALLSNAPHGILRFFAAVAGGYAPDVVGIYDDWNWLTHPSGLAGVILQRSEEQIRAAVRLLVDQIEGRPGERTLAFPSDFHPAARFGDLPAKDLSFSHLVPF